MSDDSLERAALNEEAEGIQDYYDDKIDFCYNCGEPAEGQEGTIYVRINVDGRYLPAPVCFPCWELHHARTP